MPPIPKDALPPSASTTTTLPYPNPLPVYEPQLTRKASPLSRDDEEDNSSLDTTESKSRKRVSFSSIVVDIPPPSPYTDDDDSPVSPKQTSPRGGSSSAQLLSKWQQQHQRDRLRNAIRNGAHKNHTNGESNSDHNGTRGFWESFNKEMIHRSFEKEPTLLTSTTDTRRIMPEPTRSLEDRFVPSYKSPVSPLSSTSETSSSNNTIKRYNNKTWISALQNSVSSRLSFRANTTQLNRSSPPGSLFDKKSDDQGSSNHVFDERAATRSPPLNHVSCGSYPWDV